MHCSAFIATSLDGFIARIDGSIDWLDEANKAVPPGDDMGFAAFFASVDALVMGRGTFDLAKTFTPWPYGDKRVVVLSSRSFAVPTGIPETVSIDGGEPAAILRRLESSGARRVYVDGGVTIQRFINAGLLDEITITRVPVLIGSGMPLFGALQRDVRLELVESKSYPFGYVQTRYRLR